MTLGPHGAGMKPEPHRIGRPCPTPLSPRLTARSVHRRPHGRTAVRSARDAGRNRGLASVPGAASQRARGATRIPLPTGFRPPTLPHFVALGPPEGPRYESANPKREGRWCTGSILGEGGCQCAGSPGSRPPSHSSSYRSRRPCTRTRARPSRWRRVPYASWGTHQATRPDRTWRVSRTRDRSGLPRFPATGPNPAPSISRRTTAALRLPSSLRKQSSPADPHVG